MIFELKAPKAVIKGVFSYCVTKMITKCSPMIRQFFDTMIVASSDKEWLKRPIKL